jgi:hypothetical protein
MKRYISLRTLAAVSAGLNRSQIPESIPMVREKSRTEPSSASRIRVAADQAALRRPSPPESE